MLCPHDSIFYPYHHPFYDDDPALLDVVQRLDEMRYNDLKHAIDPRDLPYTDYAPLVPYVKYVETKDNIMKYFVPSPTRINKWNVFIQFMEWNEQVADTSINPVEAARLLLWGANIRIHCPCPAFTFWGHQYVATQLDVAIYPETIYPHIRNPELKGLACKHGRRVIVTLPFHLGDMAAAIKRQRAIGSIDPAS
jgi:hypothetical protein